MTSESLGGITADAAREALRRLRAKLLDLTKRTSLLNWRASKGAAASIAVVDELPAHVYRILVIEEKAMRFRADDRAETGDNAELADEGEPMPPLLENGAEGVAGKHLDLWLQTRLAGPRLDQVQRRIADRTESIRQEQGVNTLFLALGMVHYYEAESSDEVRRAPILLVPMDLERPGANKPYQLRVGDDDIVLNPALGEMLKHQFGVTLPLLPEDPESIDVNLILTEIRSRLSGLPRWRVADEIVLSTFSFLKFVMYKDLETNAETFAHHRLFRVLLTRRGEGGLGLPADVRGLDLDRERPPEDSFEVLDADSSQQRALEAVARGHDIVVQGPPGTGKSQTIVNLIAGALAEDKTVLFVSEKRAALDVVHRRLHDVGLGDFCLELHSQKANKREVLRGVGVSLDRTLVAHAASERLRSQLPLSRAKLSEYVAAAHAVHAPLGISMYRAVGRLAKVRAAATLPWPGDPDLVTAADLEAASAALDRLAAASGAVGDPASHPWRDAALARVGALWAPDRERLRQLLARVERLALDAVALAGTAKTELGVASIDTLPSARQAGLVADLLDASPGATVEVLTSAEWNAPPTAAKDLIDLGRRTTKRRDAALQRFHPATLERSYAGAILTVERYHRKLHRMAVGAYREARRVFRSIRLSGYTATLGEQAEHLRDVETHRSELQRLEDEAPAAVSLFGRHWRGSESNWADLDRYVEWVVSFRAACIREQLEQAEAARSVANGAPSTSALRQLAEVGEELASHLSSVGGIVGWPEGYLQREMLESIAARARAMLDGDQRLGEWVAWLRIREEIGATVAGPFLARLDAGAVEASRLPAVFLRSFYEAWIAALVRTNPVLARFEAPLHDADRATFRHLDQGVLRENRDRLVGLLRLRAQERITQLQHSDSWAFLHGQLVRQRGHAPIRTLLKKSLEPIRAIKPCFMMSPLMVAQCVEADPQAFDLVIFDEASQLTPQDAVGAVVRGRQLIVVGDQRQLPPTNFFDVQVSGGTADGDGPGLEDLESILEQYQAAGLPNARLRWHYRSRHESLIAFSNANVYDWDLLTFPSADADTRTRGVLFEHVADGRYLGQGLNMIEARRVVDAVVDHARRRPDLTLGVGTFNLRQQLAIQDELECRRRDDPSLEPFFALDRAEPFFVKNLENIQGDERDVIFLSVTYGRAEDGVLRHNFGPINGQNGHRRLNVLVSRARERMVVFSSMRGDDIDPTKVQGKGAQLLRDFLIYAERGQLVSARLQVMLDAESPFEREVLGELEARGLRVVPQVGVGPYRVDIGVLDDEVPGRFICGIECDGAAYHQSETARDRDRLREEVLRRLGWNLHRVWSTDWFKWREAQVERLIALVEASRREARASAARPQESRPSSESTPGHVGSPGPTAKEPTTEPPSPAASPSPRVVAYDRAIPTPSGTPEELIFASDRTIGTRIREILEVEAPLHEDDLFSRVAECWGASRVGSRIQTRIRRTLRGMISSGEVTVNGVFVHMADRPVRPRSRAGTGIPAERIAPVEYQAAVLGVLGTGPRPRELLLVEARRLLGFDRTGSRLEERLTVAVEELLRQGRIGQASTGLALRDGRPAVI